MKLLLQRVLVALGRTDEALVVAERGRTRAFVDLLLERQQLDGGESWYASVDSTPVTKEQILEIVAKQQAAVLYFSVAAGFLYSWLITPQQGKLTINVESEMDTFRCKRYDILFECRKIICCKYFMLKGIVKFQECSVSELEVSSDPEDTQSMKSLSLSTTSLLDQFVGQVRESLGVESHLSTSRFVLFKTIKNRKILRKANTERVS